MNKLVDIRAEDLPEEVVYILERLGASGFASFLVGGAVRDLLLGLKLHDYDITTAAIPSEVREVFAGEVIVPTGLDHGTITLILNGEPFEITTFRADGEYLDHRKPETVRFSKTLEEDTKRRDFTINQIAYSLREGLVDYHGGIKDLEAGLIRTVGEPTRRFNEDALRILRCFRFASTYGFSVETDTLEAATSMVKDLDYVSGERIYQELSKLLLGEYLEGVWGHLGALWGYLFPNVDSSYYSEFNFDALRLIPNEFLHRLILLSNNKDIDVLIERLKVSKTEKIFLQNYSSVLDFSIEEIGTGVAELFIFAYENNVEVEEFLNLSEALAVARNLSMSYDYGKARENVEFARNLPRSPQELAIKGSDLLDLGLEPGKHIGEILERLWVAVVSGELDNEKGGLMRAVGEY